MDGGIVASVTSNGSIWRSTSARSDVFSISSRHEDDEEALRWAALEKLPTYNRVRKGILTEATGEKTEVDVEALGPGEKKKLIERLIRVAEEDNEKFLLKLKNRLERVGIDNPTIEVRFENLSSRNDVLMCSYFFLKTLSSSRGYSTVCTFFLVERGLYQSSTMSMESSSRTGRRRTMVMGCTSSFLSKPRLT